MRNRNMRLFCIILAVIVAVIMLGGLTGCLFMNTNDYIKIVHTEEGNDIINYDGNIYNLYTRDGAGVVAESNETIFHLSSEVKGKKIGYTFAGYGSKCNVIMLDGSNDNILVIYRSIDYSSIWIKEGYSLPDIYDAEFSKIEFCKVPNITHTNDRTLFLEKNEEYRSIKDILEMQNCIQSDKNIETAGVLYFRSNEANSLEIIMGVCIINSDYYLRCVDGKHNYSYYLVKEDFKNLITQVLEM